MTLGFHMLRASPSLAWNTSGASAGARGSLCRCLTTLRGKSFFLSRAAYLLDADQGEDCALLWGLCSGHWDCWEICVPLIPND